MMEMITVSLWYILWHSEHPGKCLLVLWIVRVRLWWIGEWVLWWTMKNYALDREVWEPVGASSNTRLALTGLGCDQCLNFWFCTQVRRMRITLGVGTSVAAQWLRLRTSSASTAGVVAWILVWGTKIPPTVQHGQKYFFKKNCSRCQNLGYVQLCPKLAESLCMRHLQGSVKDYWSVYAMSFGGALISSPPRLEIRWYHRSLLILGLLNKSPLHFPSVHTKKTFNERKPFMCLHMGYPPWGTQDWAILEFYYSLSCWHKRLQ